MQKVTVILVLFPVFENWASLSLQAVLPKKLLPYSFSKLERRNLLNFTRTRLLILAAFWSFIYD